MSGEKEVEKKKLDLTKLRDEIEQEVKYLNSKLEIEDKEVYSLSKEFFKKLLELDYEATYEELLEEINKIYIDKELRTEVMHS